MNKKQDTQPRNPSPPTKLRLRRVTMRVTSADELSNVVGGNSHNEGVECGSGSISRREV